MVKSLWASVTGNPVVMQKMNGWLTIFFIVLIPPAYIFGWLTSVTFVSVLSLWALVSGHLSAWQAARVEVKQQELEARERDVARDVVERMVERTTVERADDTYS